MKWQYLAKGDVLLLECKSYYSAFRRIKKHPFLHPAFWCDYIPAKPHPNQHKTGSLYYELYYWKEKKKKFHSYHF